MNETYNFLACGHTLEILVPKKANSTGSDSRPKAHVVTQESIYDLIVAVLFVLPPGTSCDSYHST